MKNTLIAAAALLVIVTSVVAGNSDSNEDAPPRAIVRINPHYPEAARKKGIEGKVIMKVSVSRRGDVRKVEVEKGLPDGGEGLDQAAVAAVRQWKFEPAMKDGEPVEVEFLMTIVFKL